MDKIVHKMVKINLQFAEEPSSSDLNAADLHVSAVMCGDRSAWPDVSLWQDRESRILDYCLQSTSICVSAVLTVCLKTSRVGFAKELHRQKSGLEGVGLSRGLGLLCVSRSLKSRNILKPVKPPSVRAKSTPLQLEWKKDMFAVLLGKNSDLAGKVREFRRLALYRKANHSYLEESTDVESEYMGKMHRAKGYEKLGATNPALIPYYRLRSSQQRMFKAVSGPYFPPNTPLPNRIKTIHCALLIQRAYQHFRRERKMRGILVIQAWFRQEETLRGYLRRKFESFRRVFFAGKLQHWYPLLVNKLRERKDRVNYAKGDYCRYLPCIRTMQRLARGFLVRKRVILWVKINAKLRTNRAIARFRRLKTAIWAESSSIEGNLVAVAISVESQIAALLDNLKQGKQVKGFTSEKEVTDYLNSLEKAEAQTRRQHLWQSASDRQQRLVQADRLIWATYNGDVAGCL